MVEVFFQAAGTSLTSVVPRIIANAKGIQPTPQVRSLVSHLRTSPALQQLGDKPTSCGLVGSKARRQSLCRYNAAGIDVGVAWTTRTGITSLLLEKREPKGVPPFAWADLAVTLPLLCRDIGQDRATVIASSVVEDLERAPWRISRKHESIASTADTDGASREVRYTHSPACVLELNQEIEQGDVRSMLRATPFQPNLPNAAVPG